MKKVRILVADDHDVVRHGLRSILESQRGWEVCGEASNGVEAVERAKKLKPDVVILDITMPKLDGVEATRQIREAVPQAQVLVLSMHEPDELLHDVLDAGARGYIQKTEASRELVAAVTALKMRKPFFSPGVLETMVEGYVGQERRNNIKGRARKSLTPRERGIVHLLAEGKSNKEIGATLNISERTAETHRSNIMRKLNFHSLADLVRYAVRNKIITP